MSKFKLTPETDTRIKVRYAIPGLEQLRMVTVPQWRFMVAMAKRWNLPFKFEERGDWFSIAPDGIVTNATNIAQYREQKLMRAEYVERFENAKAQLAMVDEKLKDRPRFQILDQALIDRFVKTLVQWDEVQESGLSGEELGASAPRFTVPADARMGLRLQPVKFRKYISGREFWAITPPMPFSLHADRIMAQAIGHPHVYAGDMKLCVGDAKFDYGNPFQVVGTLREWYVGYSPKDVADKDWVQHSRMWWKANGQAYLEAGGVLVEAPDKAHEKSALVPVSAEDVEKFCKASGWVAEKAKVVEAAKVVLEEVPLLAREKYGVEYLWQQLSRVSPETAQPCAMGEGVVSRNCLRYRHAAEPGDQSLYLCDCHLAELRILGDQQSRLGDYEEAERLPRVGGMCECYKEFSNYPEGTQLATHITARGARLCAGHAFYLRSGLFVEPPNPNAELKALVLSGEMGCGKRQYAVAFTELFSKLEQGWETRCKECGEAVEAHWGLACPRNAPFRLAADSELNRLGVEAWSRFDFASLDANALLWAEVGALKERFAADKKLRLAGFEGMVRRLVGADGSALDEPGGIREHWVVDTLRKFGRDVGPGTRCLDCGGKWGREEGSHNGPDCVAI